MNHSTIDMETLLQQMNDEKAQSLIPVIVYISVLMVMGIVGNLMVCFFYGFKTKTVPTSVFIITLSIYDLIVCFISMSSDMVDILMFYTFTNAPACKILHLVHHFAVFASTLTLIMIALDRYRHICHVMGEQMTVSRARTYCFMVAGLALLTASPTLAIFDAEKVSIPNAYGVPLIGSHCRTNLSSVWVLNIIKLVSFLLLCSGLIIIYVKVGKAIFQHRQRLAQYKVTMPLAQQSVDDAKIDNTTEESTKTIQDGAENLTSDINIATQDQNKEHSENNQSHTNKNQLKSSNRFDGDTIRMTLIMVTVSIVFIVSFLPYLSLEIWRSYEGKHEGQFLKESHVVYDLGTRSYLLNSCLNPLIYGIFNRKFRHYYYNLLC